MLDGSSRMGSPMQEEGQSSAVCVEEVAKSESLSPIPNAPMASMTVGLLGETFLL